MDLAQAIVSLQKRPARAALAPATPQRHSVATGATITLTVCMVAKPWSAAAAVGEPAQGEQNIMMNNFNSNEYEKDSTE